MKCLYFLVLSELTSNRLVHQFADFFVRLTMSKEEHQFGNQRFYSAVISADNACVEQVQTGFVSFHFHHTSRTLRDVYDNNASFFRFLQEFDEPWLLRSITRTVCLENNRTKAWCMQDIADDVFLNAWEKSQYNNICIIQIIRLQRECRIRFVDFILFIFNVNTSCSKCWIIV